MATTYKNFNLAIVTNSQSDELYAHSKKFYSTLGIPCYNVDGKAGIFALDFLDYVITNEAKYPFDYMIYIDEDCFVTNTNEMLSLFEYMVQNNYDSCGMPDGGVISHRFHNPISPNLFFSMFNVKKIRSIYNRTNVYTTQYAKDLDSHIPHSLLKTNVKYVKKYDITIENGYVPFGVIYDNFEPYYKLYFWMLRNNMRILYLNADDANDIDQKYDIVTTALRSHTNTVFAYHTWFARMYNQTRAIAKYPTGFHYNRIRELIKVLSNEVN